MDGLEELRDVVVIAATNRPDIIDPALLRPGRFDKLLYIPLPNRDARREIFKIHLGKKPVAEDVDIEKLVDATEGYTGADIAAICNNAMMIAIKEYVAKCKDEEEIKKRVDELKIRPIHLEEAMKKVKPISKKELELYEEASARFRGLR
jgi:transitional endoplasmic reticulum ATPase